MRSSSQVRPDTHQALENLEEYHSHLIRSTDDELKRYIERIVHAFKTNLLNGLLDIQNFYEDTLLNESKPTYAKSEEARRLAERWEYSPPLGNVGRPASLMITSTPISNGHNSSYTNGYGSHTQRPTSGHSYYTEKKEILDNDGLRWEYETVTVDLANAGLGISIVEDNMGNTRVTRIDPAGAVAIDGRMKVDDVIVKVNSFDCIGASNDTVVGELQNLRSVAQFVVKRTLPSYGGSQSSLHHTSHSMSGILTSPIRPILPPSLPPSLPPHQAQATDREFRQNTSDRPGAQRIDLYKGTTTQSLGFSISGGTNNEQVPGDSGIFVTKITEGGAAQHDGRLKSGDKIVAVNDVSFENRSYEFAQDILRGASGRVVLFVVKQPYPEYTAQGGFERTPVIVNSTIGSQSYISYHPEPAVSDPRLVRLIRPSNQGLGVNIIGGDGAPIFISTVVPNGVADQSGNVFRGDILLEVNGKNVRNVGHHEAANALKTAQNPILLLLKNAPFELQQFEEQQARADAVEAPSLPQAPPPPAFDFYVRALFDNDLQGAPQRSIPFQHGDILHVVNAADEEWWTARPLLPDGTQGIEGIIPSKKRHEKRERQRNRQVNFKDGSQSLGRSQSVGAGMGRRNTSSRMSFSRKFPFFKSTDKLNVFNDSDVSGASQTGEAFIPTYEVVRQEQIEYLRPLVLLGAANTRVADELRQQNPDRFGECVPHTSRDPRPGEINGRDYHFTTKDLINHELKNHQFIEAGELNGNLYGTHISSLNEVIGSGRQCILTVNPPTIRRLQEQFNIHPLVVLLRSENHYQIADFYPDMNEHDAMSKLNEERRIESEFRSDISNIVAKQTLADIMNSVYSIVRNGSGPNVWLPTGQQLN
ncbi:hypothetical protein L596_020615 [Steinernema carpocapsae]|uniref:Uncharacterized protein n=1 Tax=Steinernema carpocapsae TaxID=34508 RepID=A0A4U5MU28_STECR|nr:hypothetical protein L596_020615 [Steinernema carpocapsae]